MSADIREIAERVLEQNRERMEMAGKVPYAEFESASMKYEYYASGNAVKLARAVLAALEYADNTSHARDCRCSYLGVEDGCDCGLAAFRAACEDRNA